MPLHATYIKEEDRLDLSFGGNLDVTLSQDICDICSHAPSNLATCIIDLSDVERLFDSGVALLQMLYHRLHGLGAIVVILSDRPEFRKQIPVITRKTAYSVAA